MKRFNWTWPIVIAVVAAVMGLAWLEARCTQANAQSWALSYGEPTALGHCQNP